MSLTHFCQLSSYINVFSAFVFSNHISNVSLLKPLLLNTRHLFIKDNRKLKLSSSHFQKKFWGYVVFLDHGSVIYMIRFLIMMMMMMMMIVLQLFPVSLFQHRVK
ncbi:hypothetical protein Hdeb2414_s0003g00113601 [Helianthus debilis subsp. tardiflorus]